MLVWYGSDGGTFLVKAAQVATEACQHRVREGGTCAWEMKTDAATSESEERAHVTSNERVSDCNIVGGWLADSLKGRRPLVQLPSSLRSSLQRDKLNMALTTTTTDIGAGRKSGKCLGRQGRDTGHGTSQVGNDYLEEMKT